MFKLCVCALKSKGGTDHLQLDASTVQLVASDPFAWSQWIDSFLPRSGKVRLDRAFEDFWDASDLHRELIAPSIDDVLVCYTQLAVILCGSDCSILGTGSGRGILLRTMDDLLQFTKSCPYRAELTVTGTVLRHSGTEILGTHVVTSEKTGAGLALLRQIAAVEEEAHACIIFRVSVVRWNVVYPSTVTFVRLARASTYAPVPVRRHIQEALSTLESLPSQHTPLGQIIGGHHVLLLAHLSDLPSSLQTLHLADHLRRQFRRRAAPTGSTLLPPSPSLQIISPPETLRIMPPPNTINTSPSPESYLNADLACICKSRQELVELGALLRQLNPQFDIPRQCVRQCMSDPDERMRHRQWLIQREESQAQHHLETLRLTLELRIQEGNLAAMALDAMLFSCQSWVNHNTAASTVLSGILNDGIHAQEALVGRLQSVEVEAADIRSALCNLSDSISALIENEHQELVLDAYGLHPEVLLSAATTKTMNADAPMLQRLRGLPMKELGQRSMFALGSRVVLNGYDGPVLSSCVHGSLCYSGGTEGSLKVWNLVTGQCQAVLTGHRDAIRGCAVSQYGNLVVTCSNDRTIRLWDCGVMCTLRHTIVAHRDRVNACDINHDSGAAMIATVGADGIAALWGTTPGLPMVTFRSSGAEALTACSLCSGTSALITGSEAGTVTQWDTLSGQQIQQMVISGGRIWGCARSDHARPSTFAYGSADGVIRLTDKDNSGTILSLPGHTGPVLSVSWSPDSGMLYSGGWDGLLKLWDPRQPGDFVSCEKFSQPVHCVCLPVVCVGDSMHVYM